MIVIWNIICRIYSDWLHPTFVSLITILVNNQYGIYILLSLFVILLIVRKKIKIRVLPGIIDFVNAVIIILLIIVAYDSFSPTLSKFLKSNTSTNSSTSTKSTPKPSPSAQSTPTQQSTPSYTAPKQLFYSVSCSSCWNQGCPKNGYYYSGYDAASYSYYYGLCQSCSCSSVVGHSFWK